LSLRITTPDPSLKRRGEEGGLKRSREDRELSLLFKDERTISPPF
jgi:hypothetical protein